MLPPNAARSKGDPHATQAPAPARRAAPRRISSTELLGEGGELVIEHLGREYRLRRTRNGKLILTA
ncbi:MAG: hemin uptake protein HemP [Burkholderiales bacterium]|nr:hemin uptake protein HemP [Burkholderiales bacterium]